MKNSLIIISILVAFSSFGQEKIKYNGLNRVIPGHVNYGAKQFTNYYFSNYKSRLGDSIVSTVDGAESVGGGLGLFAHFDIKEHFGIQTEFNFMLRRGYVSSYTQYDLDTAQTVYKEDLSSYTTVSIEIPVYFKFRWEFTPIRSGHWKAKSQLGLFFGPRMILNPYSKRDFSRATTTRLYDNTSLSILNGTAPPSSKLNPFLGVGVALGLDYELWNGFIVHTSFYRGLTSHVSKANGIKAFDNRLEVGLGFRFN